MLAKLSMEESTIIDEMLYYPYSLYNQSDKGKQLGSDKLGFHKDGCGLGFTRGSQITIEKRGKLDAWDKSFTDIITKTKSKLFVAHIRLSSLFLNNKNDASGAQPFEKNGYIFCHNGEITTYADEANTMKTTDSMIFFNNLIGNKLVSIENIYDQVKHIAATTKYNSICGFLGSETELFAWRVYNEGDSYINDYEKYFTLNVLLKKNYAIVASEKLDDNNNDWIQLPNNMLVHIKPNDKKMELNVYRI